MHPEAYEGFGRMVKGLEMDGDFNPNGSWSVLDIGGQNVNGTVHDWLPYSTVTTLDLENADIIADATTWRSDLHRFDVVIATEVFEHVQLWREVIRTMAYHLDRNGPQLLLTTCASTGRRPHGAIGALDPAPGEWYQNVDPQDITDELSFFFERGFVTFNSMPGDAYAWAQKLKTRPHRSDW